MGWIFKDSEKENDQTPVSPKKQVFTPNTVNTVKTDKSVFSPTPDTYNSAPDEKFVSILEKVIMDNNIPGLDYIEFKQAIEKMKNFPIDESTKILTTYSIFETQGCTKDVLINAIDFYIGLINKEQENFNLEMATSYKEKVAGKKSEIENSQKQIVDLNKKITELNTFIMTASLETQEEELKLKNADASFKQSAQKVISVLQSDKEKIITYIK